MLIVNVGRQKHKNSFVKINRTHWREFVKDRPKGDFPHVAPGATTGDTRRSGTTNKTLFTATTMDGTLGV